MAAHEKVSGPLSLVVHPLHIIATHHAVSESSSSNVGASEVHFSTALQQGCPSHLRATYAQSIHLLLLLLLCQILPPPVRAAAMSSSDSSSNVEPKLQEIPFRQDKVRTLTGLSSLTTIEATQRCAVSHSLRAMCVHACVCVCVCWAHRTWMLVRCPRGTMTSSRRSERSRQTSDRPNPSAETRSRSDTRCTHTPRHATLCCTALHRASCAAPQRPNHADRSSLTSLAALFSSQSTNRAASSNLHHH